VDVDVPASRGHQKCHLHSLTFQTSAELAAVQCFHSDTTLQLCSAVVQAQCMSEKTNALCDTETFATHAVPMRGLQMRRRRRWMQTSH
jgi:hypothetical protein